MIKRISLLRRKKGLTREAFFAHWTGPHAEIIRQLPGVRGLWFGLIQKWTPEEAQWDGVGELWFDTIEAAQAAFATEPYASMLTEDRARFIGEAQSCFVEEYTQIVPPQGG